MCGGYRTVLKVEGLWNEQTFLLLAAVMWDQGPLFEGVEQTRDMGLASCHAQESPRTVRRTVEAVLSLGSGGEGWKSKREWD